MVADVCILYSHDNEWAMQQPMQPNKHFNLREHIQLFYNGAASTGILRWILRGRRRICRNTNW